MTFTKKIFDEAIDCLNSIKQNYSSQIDSLCIDIATSVNNGAKILTFGNGGSAADASHFANELTTKYQSIREPIPAISLSSNIAILSGCANDGIYNDVFSRQISVLGQKGDFAIALSTSGRSENIFRGLKMAKFLNMKTVALTGPRDRSKINFTDYNFSVDSFDPGRIQEVHLTIMHIISYYLEKEKCNEL